MAPNSPLSRALVAALMVVRPRAVVPARPLTATQYPPIRDRHATSGTGYTLVNPRSERQRSFRARLHRPQLRIANWL